jgi:hypothetical protein
MPRETTNRSVSPRPIGITCRPKLRAAECLKLQPCVYWLPNEIEYRGSAMAYWIFKCNPERYRITDRMADPNPNLTWTVSRHRDEIPAM